jgi:hypothetical protein
MTWITQFRSGDGHSRRTLDGVGSWYARRSRASRARDSCLQLSEPAGAGASALYAALELELSEAGQVQNACDEWVTPVVYPIELGGEVGRATVVEVLAGPDDPLCYGRRGLEFSIVREVDGVRTRIFAQTGHLTVLPTEHNGVRDIVSGGPGFEFPLFVWDVEGYRRAGTTSDAEMPAP